MSGAKLNLRCEFFTKADLPDRLGQRRGTQLVAYQVGTRDNKVYCSVIYPSGIETVRAGADTSIVRGSLRIRHRPGIHAGMYAEINGRMHEIESVLPDENKAFLSMPVKVVNLKS